MFLLVVGRAIGGTLLAVLQAAALTRVVEWGREVALLARRGLFYHLYRLQHDVWYEILN